MSKDVNIKKNTQDKLLNYVNSVPGDNRNESHSAKNMGLGQNTRRKG